MGGVEVVVSAYACVFGNGNGNWVMGKGKERSEGDGDVDVDLIVVCDWGCPRLKGYCDGKMILPWYTPPA